MRIPSLRSTSLALLLTFGASSSALATPPERTLSVDAVELVAGRETPGKADLVVRHEGFEYRFATPENKAAFEQATTKFAVADGGACGRMGPLSGTGDARRFAVHDGRIYFFASDACRESFKKEPAKFIETDDAKPEGCPDGHANGRAILDKVVAWAGGADAIRKVASYRQSASRKESIQGKDYAVSNVMAAQFPDRFMTRDAWNDDWFATIRGPEGGASVTELRHEPLAAARCHAFDRSLARSLPVILKAHVGAKDGDSDPGLIVRGAGDGELAQTPVYFVVVWFHGAATRFAVEKATGRPMQASFHGRDGTNSVGDAVRTFTAYKSVDGVQLPTAYTVTFDGKDLPSANVTLDGFEINPVLPGELFAVKKN